MTPAEQAQRRLEALAGRFDGDLRDAYLRAVRALRPDDLVDLARLIDAGDVDAVVDAILNRPAAAQALQGLRNAYAEALVVLQRLAARDVATVFRVSLVPKALDPALIAAVQRFDQGAFRNIVTDLRAGLREAVADGIGKGLGPRQVAVALKGPMTPAGLTAYDFKIIRSFRARLEAGEFREALQRTLRDKRFDAVLKRLQQGGALTPDQVDKMVAAYQRKLIAWRAETFARTASLQAANESAALGWRTAIDAGTVRASEVRRYWVVARDERLCERCAPIPDLNPDGVGLDEPFKTPDDGFVMAPTLHPNCRCTVYIRRQRTGVRPRPAPGTNVLLMPKV